MLFGIGDKGLIMLIALLIFFGNACSQTKEEKMKSAKEHSDKALELRYKGDIKGAIQEQLKAIESNQDDAELSVNLIAYYLDDKNTEKAKETAEMALKITPNNAWVNYLYGEILVESGKKEKALAAYLKASELDSNNFSFKLTLGTTYGDLGQFSKEKVCYQEVLKLDPKNVTAIYNLGVVAEREREIDLAIELFQQTIEIDPQNEERVLRAKDKIKNLKDLKKDAKP
jgi:tetratricopeptide (TPR) repeat protein